jgi:hypothetical protein
MDVLYGLETWADGAPSIKDAERTLLVGRAYETFSKIDSETETM